MFDAKQEDRNSLAIVLFKFWTDHVENGEGGLEAVDWASWGKLGYANWEKSEKVARLIKDAAAMRNRPDAQPCVWDALEAHYKRWKEGQEAQTDGYALEGWAGGITAGQIARCKSIHVYSVQDLAKLTDENIHKLGIDGPKLRATAQAFVDSLNGEGAKLAKENARLSAEVERLTKEAEDDRKAMREFMAKHEIAPAPMPADAAGATAQPAPTRKKAA
jgi:hypothetical protein